MPQLEQIGTFPSQVIWLVITFVALFLFLRAVALPRIGQILQQRRERIEGDLERASALKTEAEDVLAEYEKAVAEARANAQAVLRKTSDAAASEAAKRHAALGEKLSADIRRAERRIAAERDDAVNSIAAVSAELAQATVDRLTGIAVDEKTAASAVSSVRGG